MLSILLGVLHLGGDPMRAGRKQRSLDVCFLAYLFAVGCTSSGTSGNTDAAGLTDGGDGDLAMATCSPEGVFDGAPVTAAAGQWAWVDEPKALCRDGSATGFGVRINPNSDKLVIYFQGGGACFNSATCGSNPATFNSGTFALAVLAGGQQGIFNQTDSANPFRDWNAVFIPYCTGDVHAGTATGVTVPGVGAPTNQQFVGYRNVGYYLKRIIPTFPKVTRVLLTGASAGGFGSMLNYHRVAQAFCPRPVSLVNDSGPVFQDAFLAPCLQKRWRQLWNFDANLPAGCTGCSNADGSGMANYEKFIGQNYPAQRLGLISSLQDATISYFLGFGQNNCSAIDGTPGPLPGATFQAGLIDLRDSLLKPNPNWSTYYLTGTTHTYLNNANYSSLTSAGVKLTDWMIGIANQGPSSHVAP